MRGHPSHEAPVANVFATLCGWFGALVSRVWVYGGALLPRGLVKGSGSGMGGRSLHPVSYTHLTLPTILRV